MGRQANSLGLQWDNITTRGNVESVWPTEQPPVVHKIQPVSASSLVSTTPIDVYRACDNCAV